jgi:hypothetical protein
MASRDSVLKDVLTLPVDERGEIIYTLLSTLDGSDRELDAEANVRLMHMTVEK